MTETIDELRSRIDVLERRTLAIVTALAVVGRSVEPPELAPTWRCCECRNYWERRRLCAHRGLGDPGREVHFAETETAPTWCPGFDPIRRGPPPSHPDV